MNVTEDVWALKIHVIDVLKVSDDVCAKNIVKFHPWHESWIPSSCFKWLLLGNLHTYRYLFWRTDCIFCFMSAAWPFIDCYKGVIRCIEHSCHPIYSATQPSTFDRLCTRVACVLQWINSVVLWYCACVRANLSWFDWVTCPLHMHRVSVSDSVKAWAQAHLSWDFTFLSSYLFITPLVSDTQA